MKYRNKNTLLALLSISVFCAGFGFAQAPVFNNLDAPELKNLYNSPFLFYNDNLLQEKTVLNFELVDPYAEKFSDKKPFIDIVVKNSQGTLVQTIVANSVQSLGFHQFVWDGKGSTGLMLPDGAYYFQVDVRDDLGNSKTYFSYVVKGALPSEITAPLESETIRSGTYTIRGTAAKPGLFKQYALEYSVGHIDASSQATAHWEQVPVFANSRGSGLPDNISLIQVQDGPLAEWDTRGIPNGSYTLRLTVVDKHDSRTVIFKRVVVANPVFISDLKVDRSFITPTLSIFPFTKISYKVTKPSDITLNFYNTKGTEGLTDDELVYTVSRPGSSANFLGTPFEDFWSGQNFGGIYQPEGTYRVEVKVNAGGEVVTTNAQLRIVTGLNTQISLSISDPNQGQIIQGRESKVFSIKAKGFGNTYEERKFQIKLRAKGSYSAQTIQRFPVYGGPVFLDRTIGQNSLSEKFAVGPLDFIDSQGYKINFDSAPTATFDGGKVSQLTGLHTIGETSGDLNIFYRNVTGSGPVRLSDGQTISQYDMQRLGGLKVEVQGAIVTPGGFSATLFAEKYVTDFQVFRANQGGYTAETVHYEFQPKIELWWYAQQSLTFFNINRPIAFYKEKILEVRSGGDPSKSKIFDGQIEITGKTISEILDLPKDIYDLSYELELVSIATSLSSLDFIASPEVGNLVTVYFDETQNQKTLNGANKILGRTILKTPFDTSMDPNLEGGFFYSPDFSLDPGAAGKFSISYKPNNPKTSVERWQVQLIDSVGNEVPGLSIQSQTGNELTIQNTSDILNVSKIVPIKGVVSSPLGISQYFLSYQKEGVFVPIKKNNYLEGDNLGIWDVSFLQEGSYSLQLVGVAVDGSLNAISKTVQLNTPFEPFQLTAQNEPLGSESTFSPDWQSNRISFFLSESGSVSLSISNSQKLFVKNLVGPKVLSRGLHTFFWNGKNEFNQTVADGEYKAFIEVRDTEKNALQEPLEIVGASAPVGVKYQNKLLDFLLLANRAELSPIDTDGNKDGINDDVGLKFILSEPAAVSMEVFDQMGVSVRTLVSSSIYQSGSNEIVWDGKNNSGSYVSPAIYIIRATAVAQDVATDIKTPPPVSVKVIAPTKNVLNQITSPSQSVINRGVSGVKYSLKIKATGRDYPEVPVDVSVRLNKNRNYWHYDKAGINFPLNLSGPCTIGDSETVFTGHKSFDIGPRRAAAIDDVNTFYNGSYKYTVFDHWYLGGYSPAEEIFDRGNGYFTVRVHFNKSFFERCGTLFYNALMDEQIRQKRGPVNGIYQDGVRSFLAGRVETVYPYNLISFGGSVYPGTPGDFSAWDGGENSLNYAILGPDDGQNGIRIRNIDSRADIGYFGVRSDMYTNWQGEISLDDLLIEWDDFKFQNGIPVSKNFKVSEVFTSKYGFIPGSVAITNFNIEIFRETPIPNSVCLSKEDTGIAGSSKILNLRINDYQNEINPSEDSFYVVMNPISENRNLFVTGTVDPSDFKSFTLQYGKVEREKVSSINGNLVFDHSGVNWNLVKTSVEYPSNNSLGLIDISDASGFYTLLLKTETWTGEVTETYKDIRIGNVVSRESGGFAESPNHFAILNFAPNAIPPQAFDDVPETPTLDVLVDAIPTFPSLSQQGPVPFGKIYNFQPSGISFTDPRLVLLKMKYFEDDPSFQDLKTSFPNDWESRIGTYHIRVLDGVTNFEYLPGFVDKRNHELYVNIPGFSSYVLAKDQQVIPKPVIIGTPLVVSADQMDIGGTAPSNLKVVLKVNGNTRGFVLADQNGRFAFQRMNLVEGLNQLVLYSENSQGLRSAETTSSVNRDTVPPVLTVLDTPDSIYLSCKQTLQAKTVSYKLNEDGYLVLTLFSDSGVVLFKNEYQSKKEENSSFSLSDIPQAFWYSGASFSLLLQSRDLAGNQNFEIGSHRIAVHCDHEAPTVSFLSATTNFVSGKNLQSGGISISAQVDDDVSPQVIVNLEIRDSTGNRVKSIAQNKTNNLGSISYFWDGRGENGLELQDGQYQVTLTAFDLAYNVSETKQFSINVDSTVLFDKNQIGLTSSFLSQDRSDIGLTYSVGETGTVVANLFDSTGRFVATICSNFESPNGKIVKNVSRFDSSGLAYPDGRYNLNVEFIDQAGNSYQVFKEIVIDTVPPRLEVSSPITGQDVSGILELRGTAEDINLNGYNYSLVDKFGVVQSAGVFDTIVVDGLLARIDTSSLSGDFTLKLLAVDSAENQTEISSPLRLVNDPSANFLKIVLLDGAIIAPGSSQAGIKKESTLIYEVTEAATVSTFIKDETGNILLTLYQDQNLQAGKYSVKWDGTVGGTAVADGKYQFAISALNNTTSISVNKSVDVMVEVDAPLVSLSGLENGSFLHGLVDIKGSISSPILASYRVEVGQGDSPTVYRTVGMFQKLSSDNLVSLDTRDLANSAYIFKITAFDFLGRSNWATVKVQIDNEAPLSRLAPFVSGVVNGNSLAFQGTAFDQNIYRYSLKYRLLGSDSWNIGFERIVESVFNGSLGALNDNLAIGKYEARLEVEDKAGNISIGAMSFEVDNDVPVTAITSPAPGTILSGTAIISGSIADQNLNNYVLSFRGETGADWTRFAERSIPSGETLGLWNLIDLPSGNYTLKLDAVDKSGLVGTSEVPVVVDNAPPVFEILSPTINQRVTSKFQLKINATDLSKVVRLAVFLRKVDDSSAEYLSLRTFDFDEKSVVLDELIDSDLLPGQYSLKIVGQDYFGHQTIQFVTIEVLDSTPPKILNAVAVPNVIFYSTDNKYSTLTFTLSKGSLIDVNVVNAAGVYVRSLISGRQSSDGLQVYSWNALDDAGALLADGDYHFEVRAKDIASKDVAIENIAVGLQGADLAPPVLNPSSFVSYINNLRNPVNISFQVADVSPQVNISSYVRDKNLNIVRHLFANQLLNAGEQSVFWDGIGDSGMPLVEGEYSLYVVARDLAGNSQSGIVGKFIIDDWAPRVLQTISPSVVRESTLYAGPSSTLELAADDALSGLGSIKYRFNLDSFDFFTGSVSLSGLPQGANSLDYFATDLAGNTSTIAHLNFYVDGTAPSTLLSCSLPFYTNTVGEVFFSEKSSISLSSLDPESGAKTIFYQVNDTGWVSYSGPFQLGLGEFSIKYYSIDQAGNIESERTVTIKSPLPDLTPPITKLLITTAIYTNAGEEKYLNTLAGLSLLAVDSIGINDGIATGVALTEISIDGHAWIPYQGNTLVFADGAHVLKYRSTDNSGNIENDQLFIFKSDGAAPITVVNLDDGHGTLSTATNFSLAGAGYKIVLSATDPVCKGVSSGVGSTEYRVTSGSWSRYAGAIDLDTLSDGSNQISFRSVDRVQNIETSKSLSFYKDTAAPRVAFLSPAEGDIVSTKVPVFAMVSDISLSSYNLYAKKAGETNLTLLASGMTNASGFIGVWNTAGISNGSYTLVLKAKDSSGQESSASVNVEIGNAEPIITYGNHKSRDHKWDHRYSDSQWKKIRDLLEGWADKHGMKGFVPADKLKLSGPAGLNPNNDDFLYLTDPGSHTVRVFDGLGNQLYTYDELLATNSRSIDFKSPYDVAFTRSGDYYILDKAANFLHRFSFDGQYLYSLGGGKKTTFGGTDWKKESYSASTNKGFFSSPESVDVDKDGNVYVADTENGRVQVFSDVGNFVRIISGLSKPRGVYVVKQDFIQSFGSNETLLVADSGTASVKEYSLSGTLLGSFTGTSGTGSLSGNIRSGASLAFGTTVKVGMDYLNRLVVLDEKKVGNDTYSRVLKYDRYLNLQLAFTNISSSTNNGKTFPYKAASGLSFDKSRGYFYLSDTANQKVEKLKLSSRDFDDRTVPIADIRMSVEKTKNKSCRFDRRTSDVLQIFGEAADAYLSEAVISYGVGNNPQVFKVIDRLQISVWKGLLTSWDVKKIPEGVYTLKLDVYDLAGNISSDRMTVEITSGKIDIAVDGTNSEHVAYVNHAPYPPTNVSLDKLYYKASDNVQVSWLFTDPDFGDKQDGFVVKVDKTGGTGVVFDNRSTTIRYDQGLVFSASQLTGDGEYNVSVQSYDNSKAGSAYSSIKKFLIDGQNPTITITGVNDGASYFGSVTPFVTVSDANFKSTTTTFDGQAFVSGTTVSSVGAHEIIVTALDQAGNQTTRRVSFSIAAPVAQNTNIYNPQITVTGVADGQYSSANIHIDVLFQDSFADKSVTLNGAAASSWTTSSSGVTASFDVTLEGTYVLFAQGLDLNGITRTASASFKIDKTAPVVQILGVTNGGFYHSATPSSLVTGEVSGEYTVSAKLSGADFILGSSVTTDGTYFLVVTAVDKAGNATVKTVTFTVDATAPVIMVSGVNSGSYYNTGVIVNVQVTEANLLKTTISLNGSPVTLPLAVSSEGRYNLKVTATDKAGNVSSRIVDFTVDKTLPIVLISGIQNGGKYVKADLGVKIYEPNLDKANSSLKLDSGDLIPSLMTNADQAGAYSGLAITNFTNAGAHALVYSIKDLANNSVNGQVNFEILPFDVKKDLLAWATYDKNTKLNFSLGDLNEYSSAQAVYAGGYHSNCDQLGVNASDTVTVYKSLSNIDGSKGTLGIWLKPSWTTAGSANHTIFALKNSDTSAEDVFALKAHVSASEGTVFAFKDKNNNLMTVTAQKVLPEASRWYAAGVWTYITFTWDITTGKALIYANGLKIGEGTITGTPKNDTKYFLIGAAKDTSTLSAASSFAGKLDELRVYNRALSEDEVRYLYELEK